MSKTFKETRSREGAQNYIAERFGKSQRGKYKDEQERLFARELVELIGTKGSIADIAAGPGRFYDVFKNQEFLLSLDLDPNMLAVIKDNHPDRSKGKLVIADATQIALADNCVDLSFCMRLFHHIAESEVRTSILLELARVSRQWVAVSYYRTESWSYWRRKISRKSVPGNPIPSKQFFDEAESAGLKKVKKIGMYVNGTAQTLVLLKKQDMQ